MTRKRTRLPSVEARPAMKSRLLTEPEAPFTEAKVALAGEHVVQFYDSDATLLDTLTQFVLAGLDAGEACLVIATRAHRAQLDARLRASGRDMRAARRQGRYRAMDADALLRTFMVGDEPDPARFTRALTRLLRPAVRGGRAVRAFGEMVAQLWLAGNQRGAIQLEALWNDLRDAEKPSFTLLCAYPAALLADESAHGALAAVCEQHARVIPRVAGSHRATAEQRLQALARLQQDAHALQVEVEQRRLVEARLRSSELRYRALFESARDGIVMLEARTGRIADINPAAVALLGQPRERLIGRELWQVGLFATRAMAREALVAMRTQPAPRWEALPFHPPDAPVRLLELAASSLRIEDADMIQCTLRDVTERQQLERETARRTAELEAIHMLTESALAHTSLDDVLLALMEQLRTVLAVDNVAILLADETGQELVLQYVAGPEEEVLGHVRVPLGRGVAGRIAATRELLIIEDLREVPVENAFLRERLRSLMGVPLVIADRLIGVIHVDTTRTHVFTADEARLLRLVAERVAQVIERAQLLEEVERARRAAVQRANQLDATIEAIADGVVVFDAGGRLIQMNAAAQRMLGEAGQPDYTVTAASPGLHHVRDGAGKSLRAAEWPVLRVLRGEEISSEQAVDLRVRGADDRDLDVSVSGAPVRDAKGAVQGAVCVFRDVTAQRRLERRTHDALQALLAMAGELFDLPEGGDTGAAEQEALSLDGVAGPPATSAEARRLADLARDVLACERIAIVTIDPETRVRTPVAVAGLTPEQEQHWWAEQPGQDGHGNEVGDPELAARLEAGETVVVDMTRPPFASLPNPYGVSTSLVAPMRIGSRLMGLLAIDFGGPLHTFTDQERALTAAVARLAAMVVERERLLRERAEARASALAAQETAERMNTLLGIAGHELRTPVTSIKAGVQLAERAMAVTLRDGATPAAAQALRRAQTLLLGADQQANRLARLIEDVLDVARTQAGKLELRAEWADLSAVVRQAVESQYLNWPERTITLDAPAAPVTLSMDADRIEQVVVNLVSNALKYSPADQPVSVRISVEGDVARVAVRDHGPGLAPALQAQIWEPFYRVADGEGKAESVKGLGLGLHICRTLIERHNGRIGVESVEGRGSTFWFELPMTPATDGAPELAVEAARRALPGATAESANRARS